ncbi:hypothetical protein B0T17DRAFT_596824 [Bombardia bombarda]|uniref:Uncharacterized protein n=1 Tax=Bombardia bombarda TaxID=252184 RepID=A0AA39X6G0_9PEZI|nr:hypothetical protein B0T17DRAFT_596824 [Bombardia bombarda]
MVTWAWKRSGSNSRHKPSLLVSTITYCQSEALHETGPLRLSCNPDSAQATKHGGENILGGDHSPTMKARLLSTGCYSLCNQSNLAPFPEGRGPLPLATRIISPGASELLKLPSSGDWELGPQSEATSSS